MGKPTTPDEILPATGTADSVGFDFDITSDAVQKSPGFRVRVTADDDIVHLANPEDLEWKEWEVTMRTGNAFSIFGALIEDEKEAEVFFNTDLTLGVVKRTLQRWAEHFSVEIDVQGLNGGQVAANRAEKRAAGRKGPRRR